MATIPPVPNSSTGGYLVPDAAAPPPYPPPLDDAALEDLFHDVLAGVLGWDLAGNDKNALIRPRFQLEPPNDPPATTDWVAFGFQSARRDFDRYEHHEPDYYEPGVGAIITEQDQELELHLSWYGPNAGANQGLFEDGIKIAQNRDPLDRKGIKFMGAIGDAFRLPALLKERFRNRWDQKFRFRRRVYRVVPILSLESATAGLDNEHYITPITVNPPTP